MAELALATTSTAPVRSAPLRKVSWHAFDLASGRRGAQVHPTTKGKFSRVLSEPTDTQLDINITRNGAPVPDWVQATEPGWVMLVALDEEQDENPIWGGMVLKRVRKPNRVTVAMATLEAYLDRRFINGLIQFAGADQVSKIAADVVTTTLANGIDFTVDAPASGIARDRTYTVDEDKTIGSILSELEEVQGGIAYTVDLAWADDDHTVLERIIRIRNRDHRAGLGPSFGAVDRAPAVFHMPGSVVDFTYDEDYTTENGANAVVATSSGEGDDRPESMRHIAAGVVKGWGGLMAMFERRWEPSSSIIETATLDGHAANELQETWDGFKELILEASLDQAPRLGSDWWLGDVVTASLTCATFPERSNSDGERVPGYEATSRCTGWEIDLDNRRVKPRLLEFTEIEVEAL